MTEIPEHLLARSRARRAAMGGGGGDTPAPTESAATPATTSSAPAPAAAAPAPAAPAVPEAPAPVPPWVEAANERKKIPYWAVPVLALLPVWAVVYMLTLDKPTDLEQSRSPSATSCTTPRAARAATARAAAAAPRSRRSPGPTASLRRVPEPGRSGDVGGAGFRGLQEGRHHLVARAAHGHDRHARLGDLADSRRAHVRRPPRALDAQRRGVRHHEVGEGLRGTR